MRVELDYGWEPEGPTQDTGGGGKQAFYAHPGGEVSNKAGLLPGVDIRGDGGYVVAPPSLHASGKRYRWCEDPNLELPELPDWLSKKLTQPAPDLPADQVAASDDLDIAFEQGVKEGQRNETATRLAGRYFGKGRDKTDVLTLLEGWNQRNEPPLPSGELRRVVASVEKMERRNHPERFVKREAMAQGFDLRDYNTTDAGNAELFAAVNAERLRYDHGQGRWLVWRGDWWSEDVDEAPKRIAKEVVRLRYALAADVEDDSARERHGKWAIKSESRRRLSAMTELAKAEKPLADDGKGWNTDRYLLGVANGVIDLRDGSLREGRREDGITLHTDVAFDPDAPCPLWESTLLEVCSGDADLAAFLQRALGMSLTGDTSERVFFALYGEGDNGKSLILKMARHILGPLGWEAGFDTFTRRRNGGGLESLAALDGKRLVTAVEANDGAELDEARLKAVSGNDGAVTARHLYRERFSFEPQATVWLAFNHKPKVRDDSAAFWGRMRLVHLRERFKRPTDCGPGEKEADLHLGEKLKQEAPGILAWAVRGCVDWQRDGLQTPSSVRATTKDYRDESDIIGQFVEEYCIRKEGAQVQARRLFGFFKEWAESELHMRAQELPSRTAFGTYMGRVFDKKRTSRGIAYEGVQCGGIRL